MHQHQLAVSRLRNVEFHHMRAKSNRFAKCRERILRVRIAGAAVSTDTAHRHFHSARLRVDSLSRAGHYERQQQRQRQPRL
jgi:hypothetical protein